MIYVVGGYRQCGVYYSSEAIVRGGTCKGRHGRGVHLLREIRIGGLAMLTLTRPLPVSLFFIVREFQSSSVVNSWVYLDFICLYQEDRYSAR